MLWSQSLSCHFAIASVHAQLNLECHGESENLAQGQDAGAILGKWTALDYEGFGGWEALGWVASRATKPWATQSHEGSTHCDVDLDGLALLEAQVQFGAFIWVLGLLCKLTLLLHPPEDREKRNEPGTAAAILLLPQGLHSRELLWKPTSQPGLRCQPWRC